MRTARVVLTASAGLLFAALPLVAHHSFKAEYDQERVITLKGTITEVNWQNPHVHFHMKVKGADGKSATWELELGSPNLLLSQGWALDSLRPGDPVTVEGYPAKNGANLASARKVTRDAK